MIIMENRVLNLIESAQKQRRSSSITGEFISKYNAELLQIKNDLLKFAFTTEIHKEIQNLLILNYTEISTQLSPISIWERPQINKWMGSWDSYIFSNRQLPIRKYLMINHFTLETILRKTKHNKVQNA